MSIRDKFRAWVQRNFKKEASAILIVGAGTEDVQVFKINTKGILPDLIVSGMRESAELTDAIISSVGVYDDYSKLLEVINKEHGQNKCESKSQIPSNVGGSHQEG